MHYLFGYLTLGQLVVVLILVAIVQGDYIIDNANSTIQYTGSKPWPQVDPILYPMDPSKLYDGTV